MDGEAQRKVDQAAGRYTVTIRRMTPGSQCYWFCGNPQGGGFGSNTASPSLRLAEAIAVRNIPVSCCYRLIVNGQDRGIKRKESR